MIRSFPSSTYRIRCMTEVTKGSEEQSEGLKLSLFAILLSITDTFMTYH
jgi:hypothetical protein